jgi:hypothetical protein
VRSRAASAALIILALVTAPGCGGDGGDERPDEEQVVAAATDYARAFGAGDGEKACSLLTPGARDAFVKRVSTLVGTSDCAEAVQKLQAVAGPNVTGPFRVARATGAKVDGDEATVEIRAGSGTAEVGLEERDGEWLLTRAPGT